MTLYICGNSHTRALRAGAIHLQEEEGAEPMVVFPLGTSDNEGGAFSQIRKNRVVLTNQRFSRKLKQFFGFSNFDPAQRWGICMGTHHAALYGDAFWLKAAPTWMNMDGKIPVSEALFQQMHSQSQVHFRAFIEQLLETGVRPFVISAPWPLRIHPAIADVGVPPEIVKAIDTRARVLGTQWLMDRGISVVTPPLETADEEGFLRPEFMKGGKDRYHGNHAYGRLMMLKVLQHEERTSQSA